MKLIALDSSGLTASAAIWEDGALLAEYTVNYKKTHSQTLLPMLDELKKMTELDLNSVDAIAVAAGPGSFTGLRIGSATAKGLGLALQIPIVPVPTVDALAYNYYGAARGDFICPLMDARRGQVYTGIYTFEPEPAKGPLSYRMVIHYPQSAVMLSEVLSVLNAQSNINRVIFLGDGVPVYQKQIEETMNVPYLFAPAGQNRQRAASVAFLGSKYYEDGKTESADEHAPVYLRMSQAERERLEAEGKQAGQC